MQRFLSAYRWNMDRYAWLIGHADVPVGGGVEGLISLMPQENQSQPLGSRQGVIPSEPEAIQDLIVNVKCEACSAFA
jgi:hypothetical protein